MEVHASHPATSGLQSEIVEQVCAGFNSMLERKQPYGVHETPMTTFYWEPEFVSPGSDDRTGSTKCRCYLDDPAWDTWQSYGVSEQIIATISERLGVTAEDMSGPGFGEYGIGFTIAKTWAEQVAA